MLVVATALLIAAAAVVRRARRGTWVVDRTWLRRGLALVGAGLVLWVGVRLVNDWVTPSTADALRTAGRPTRTAGGGTVGKLSHHRFVLLGDVVAWPAPLPLATVVGLPQLLALFGLGLALRLPRGRETVHRVELVTGQFWWDAPPTGDERLEVVVPGAVLRSSDARLGVEVGPRGGLLVVVDGSVEVEGPGGTVEVGEGSGLTLTPDGPATRPEPLAESELRSDPWIAEHLDPPAGRHRPRVVVEGRALPVTAILAGIVVALMAISTYVVQVATVPSGSMRPTLSEGDRVVVAKAGGSPAPGDVVVFERPPSLTTGPVLLVKRVVAVGGQTVRLERGRVVVDGKVQAEGYLPDGTRTEPACGNRGEVRVPPGRLFVLGDNRSDSYDSRCFGPVKGGSVVGTVGVRLWPPGGTG